MPLPMDWNVKLILLRFQDPRWVA